MNSGVSEKINKDFLQDFIEGEKYLQNPPMKTDEFIDFCKKRGIQTTKEELEFFEHEKLLFPIIRIDLPVGEEERIKFRKADGQEYWRPVRFGLQEGETEIERRKTKFYSSYGFSELEYDKELLLDWFKEGLLFDPATKEFHHWESFVGEDLAYERQKIVSFYSNFQIYWLEILKETFSFTLDLSGNNIKVSSSFALFDNCRGSGSFTIDSIDNFARKLKETAQKEPFDKYFDLDVKKENIRKEYEKFNIILKFFLYTQTVYLPYLKSGGNTIQISGNEKKWRELRYNFELKGVLSKLNVKIEDIAVWYGIFSDEARKILGIGCDGWVQLWKNIAWDKKDSLGGNIRLGIDYLQWSVMIKRIIEDHLQREILDIDEISNISHDDILNLDPKNMEEHGGLLRAIRNKRYSDNDKNYYHDHYKRLFYLSNNFGLDYQPRLTVFVEGETEELVFPIIFERYKGIRPENLGIEFINFKGVYKLLSTAEDAKKLHNILIDLQKREKQQILSKNKNKELNELIKKLESADIVMSNLISLLSYNLMKWQIIPFFVSDNEGSIKDFLDAKTLIQFNGEDKKYNIIDDWKFLWGVTNNNEPLRGRNFELANFEDDEVAIVLSGATGKIITEQMIKELRDQDKGIEQISGVKIYDKAKISEKLFENLFDKYTKDKNEIIFKRPIFKAIDKIIKLAILNHPPVDTRIEIENRRYIKGKLENKFEP
ncbi:MAG: TOPRIM nucleotidyl transferase/hydrolase domain-containing protein [Candidatus Paceibacterota bacterium]|jgi:hypothetical protein